MEVAVVVKAIHQQREGGQFSPVDYGFSTVHCTRQLVKRSNLVNYKTDIIEYLFYKAKCTFVLIVSAINPLLVTISFRYHQKYKKHKNGSFFKRINLI